MDIECGQEQPPRVTRPRTRKVPSFSVDQSVAAAYLRLLNKPIVRTEEVTPLVLIDRGANNEAVGVELLGYNPTKIFADRTQHPEGERPDINELKAELQARSAEIPFATWSRFFPDLQIPIGSHMESPLLPARIPFGSHQVDGDGKPLAIRHTVGNDAVETYLGRNGRLMEKLVHYTSDGHDSEKRYLDEVLGETSDERYQWGHRIAIDKLRWLKDKGSETPTDQ